MKNLCKSISLILASLTLNFCTIAQEIHVSPGTKTIKLLNKANSIAISDTTFGIHSQLTGISFTSSKVMGLFNEIKNTGNSNQYGLYNRLNIATSNEQFGSYSEIGGSGTGNQYGNYNFLQGNGNLKAGNWQSILVNSGSTAYGSINTLYGSSGGILTGIKQLVTNTGDGLHRGVHNDLYGPGTGKHYAVDNNLGGIGSGDQFGINQTIVNTGNGIHYGIKSELTGTGTGIKYGSHTIIDAAAATAQYGAFNQLTANATTVATGVYNFMDHYGTGNLTGTHNILNNYGNTGSNTGTLNELSGGSDASHTGVRNNILSDGVGVQYGVYNNLDNDSPALRYGVYTKMTGGASGSHFGTLNLLTNTGSGDRYGSYNNVGGTGLTNGTHIAGYFKATGSGTNYAAIFDQGHVLINDSGLENNLQVKSLDFANMLFVDGTNNKIGIRNGVPTDVLTINSSITEPAFRVEIGSNTKFRIHANGSISIGSNNTNVSDNDTYFDNQVGYGVNAPIYRIELENNTNNSLGRGRAFAWDVYSDKRVKDNILPVKYGLAEVLQMNPVHYNHHASTFENGKLLVKDEFDAAIGFIAQEIHKIIPEVVSKPVDESTNLWSMNYEKLIPVLVNAIKEQQKQINSQSEFNKSQTDLLKKLTARVEKLEGENLKSIEQ